MTAQGLKTDPVGERFRDGGAARLRTAQGYLGLEGEGYHIEFRNLKLKELP